MNTLKQWYPWILLAPAALPVVIGWGVIYPYLVPKTLLFYTLALVALAGGKILASRGTPLYLDRLRGWAWVPALLLALMYVSSFFGVDFSHSFWSTFVRGDGLLMYTGVVASFYLLLLFGDRALFTKLLRIVAVMGSIVAIYGIGEWLFQGGRIGSLLGNAGFFAGYLGMAAFATLAAAEGLSGGWRRAARIGAALQFVAIILTATRGTMLALAVTIAAVLVFFAVKGTGVRRTWALTLIGAGVVVSGLFFAFRTELARIPFEPIARVASAHVGEADIESRLFIWRNTIEWVGKRPVLGYGAEQIDTLFNRFYDPSKIVEEWFDRSHNAYLDYAVQFGVGGLILYILLIGLFAFNAWRLTKEGREREGGFLFLLVLTYAVQNFFIFDTISSFWLFMALLALLMASRDRTSARSLGRSAASVSWVAAAVLIVLIYPFSIKPALAAYDLAQAYKYQLTDPAKEAEYLNRGMDLETYGGREYGYLVYDMYANTQASMLRGEAKVLAYTTARDILKQMFMRYPYDARTALCYASVLSLAPAEVPADPNELSSALARATSESPKRAQPWFLLANLVISQANTYPVGSAQRASFYASATDILEQYIAQVPDFSQPHYVLAQLAYATGDRAGAAREAALGKASYRSNAETAKRAAEYYVNVGEWRDAAFFLEERVKAVPTDDVSRLDLAKVKYVLGDQAGSYALVQEMRSRIPNILDSDLNFKAAITAYEQSH